MTAPNKIFFWITYLISCLIIMVFYYTLGSLIRERTYPNPCHKTIYVSREFTDRETLTIKDAAMEWNSATNHILQLQVKKMPTKVGSLLDAIFVVKVSVDNPDIVQLDRVENGETAVGFFNQDHGVDVIELVPDRLSNDIWYRVVLHEIGHVVGLQHNDSIEDIYTLMFPTTDLENNHITRKDLVRFCKLYNCNAYDMFKYLKTRF